MSVPHHDILFVDMVHDVMDKEIDGMFADSAMQMKEVILAALDNITMEVKWLLESLRKLNDRQTFESVLI